MKFLKSGKSLKTAHFWLARDGILGANEDYLLNGYRVYFFKWWKYSKIDGCTTLNILKTTELLKGEEI